MSTTIDAIRFRSTCSLWRSILPPPPRPSSSYKLLTFQYLLDSKFRQLLQSKIYRLEPLVPTCSSSSSCSSNKGWIIKVEESTSGKLRQLDILTNIDISHIFPSTVLDFMNLRISELFETYNIYSSNVEDDLNSFERVNDIYRLVLLPVEGHGQMVFILNKDRKLRICSNNRYYNNLILVEDWITIYDDIIIYMEKVYVVDTNGILFWINFSSHMLVQSSPPLNSDGKKKYLVESHGRLYVFDMLYKRTRSNNIYNLTIAISVLVVDNDSTRWLRVSDLGDDAFVLGKDSNFSLSAKDYYGFEKNCIYFRIKDRAACFSLKDQEFKFVDHYSLWPCPTLFNSNF
ncbi:LOW QUALITY PROTEIN: putative F-box protein At3g25750 [Trifolium pratense]|uniref:LOW QUALITY PROTEIN: putative F-box protein At3g25750 n=1 Tax=Trifolium pratense TaxID=57577 RepID=UPI001E690697|nr:LOW QUALITY PROTEIN: putative F-box protein At3g25750 [Trifolium pratense]